MGFSEVAARFQELVKSGSELRLSSAMRGTWRSPSTSTGCLKSLVLQLYPTFNFNFLGSYNFGITSWALLI